MRPAIIGMNNPTRAGDPLSPMADRNAGHRLWRMSGMALADYEATFERINLLPSRRWLPWQARAAGRKLRRQLAGRSVVVLGRGVWQALGLDDVAWFASTTIGGTTFTLLPHPSGRNLIYNDAANREEVRRCLSQFLKPSPTSEPSTRSATPSTAIPTFSSGR
ncbi:MAG TPA: hypothetical protein VN903_09905 [Polyangia bacterium]|nr:hypothetical protein [Polyangia bacterium]